MIFYWSSFLYLLNLESLYNQSNTPMENKPHFIFTHNQEPVTNDEAQQTAHQVDIKSLQKVVLQSFKYCQAKKSKNRYIRSKKVQEMKSYQKKLIAIVKRKSQQAIASLLSFSSQMVLAQQTICNESSKTDDQTLLRLKQKLTSLKQTTTGQSVLKQKIKRVTVQCEQQLEKMQSSEMGKKTDAEIDQLIDKMQRPFKKLCGYFSLISKELKQMKQAEQDSVELRKNDSEQTQE